MVQQQKDLKLTLERLREILRYDSVTGDFVWASKVTRETKVGARAGTRLMSGHWFVKIDGRSHTLGRLAWLSVYGEWPAREVEFIDGDRNNHRIANLRLRTKVPERELTVERLKELLDYDPATGRFAFKEAPSRRVKVGDEAGVVGELGYRQMSVDNKRYLAHRLAWFWTHREWPEVVDHINGDRDDNRIGNLRSATTAQNAWNSGIRPTNTSGHKGVSWSKAKKKWQAKITVNYLIHILGYFDTKEEAGSAYKEAADRLHGVFANVGKPEG